MKSFFYPIRAQLVVIRRCNLACAYCNEFDDRSEPIACERLQERIEHLRRLQTRQIEFTGGEPLMHPHITSLVTYAKQLGFEKILMITNGVLLSRNLVEGLNQSGLDDMQVSIDAVTPNSMTVKALRPLLPKLDLLARFAHFRVTMNAVIGSSSPHELIEIVNCARQYGFIPRVLVRHDEYGQAEFRNDEIAAYADIIPEIADLLIESHGYRAKLLRGEPAPFKCRAGCSYLYIDEWGIVRWCSQQRQHLGVPLIEYSRDHLKQQFYTRKPCSDRCTLGCARTASADHESHQQPITLSASEIKDKWLMTSYRT